MNWNITNYFLEAKENQNEYPLLHVKAAIGALVDAIIPNTPKLAEELGSIHLFGALDLHVDKYQIWLLEHFLMISAGKDVSRIYLAQATTEMLNLAAAKLTDIKGNKEPLNFTELSEKDIFAALAPSDRFRAISLLEKFKVNITELPIPFRNNLGFLFSIILSLTGYTLIGYYSEWSGYGSTLLELPEKRKLEHFPVGWEQAGYPGPSKGYHALRKYFDEKFTE